MVDLINEISKEVLNRISLDPLRGKSVLILGSNGLIGSHLCAVIALANRQCGLGARVTAISRSPAPHWLAAVFAQPGFQALQCDLVHEDFRPFESEPYDFIIHGATYGQPKKFLDSALDTIALNSTVTDRLLKISERNRASFLFLSSSEIYGNATPEVMPIPETYPGNASPIDHRSPYTSSKRFSETLCKTYNDLGKCRTRIARVSSAYGPGVKLNDDRVLNFFIREALGKNRIEMLDDGGQKRRWLYIRDAAHMLFYILLYSNELVYNVSGTAFHSILELAQLICNQTGAELRVPAKQRKVEHTQGAPDLIDIDNQRIVKEAGMGDLVTLKQGVQECIQWTRYLMEQ